MINICLIGEIHAFIEHFLIDEIGEFFSSSNLSREEN